MLCDRTDAELGSSQSESKQASRQSTPIAKPVVEWSVRDVAHTWLAGIGYNQYQTAFSEVCHCFFLLIT